jgi:hypothetical protein
MNPPYNNASKSRLSDHILVELYENNVATDIITIQPCRPLFSFGYNLQDRLGDSIETVIIKNPNMIWEEVKMKSPVAIIRLSGHNDKIKLIDYCCDIYNSNERYVSKLQGELYGTHIIAKQIYAKVNYYVAKHGSLDDIITKESTGDYFVKDRKFIGSGGDVLPSTQYIKTDRLAGGGNLQYNGYAEGWFSIVGITKNKFISDKPFDKHIICGSYEDAELYYNYLRSDFTIFAMAQKKVGWSLSKKDFIPRINHDIILTKTELELVINTGIYPNSLGLASSVLPNELK